MKDGLYWTLVIVLFVAGTYIAEAFSKHRDRMKKIEERLEQLERNGK